MYYEIKHVKTNLSVRVYILRVALVNCYKNI